MKLKQFLIAILLVALSVPVYCTPAFAAAQPGTVNAEEYATTNRAIEFAQLTAATDNTQKIKLTSARGDVIYKNVLFQITVAGITTNVVYRLEGSLDGTNWFNLNSGASNVTKTADGTYWLNYVGNGEIIFIRLYWVSEAGGTAATLDISAKVYNREVVK